MLDQLFDEFEETKDLMLKELRKINSKGDLSKDELCVIKEMVETIYKMQIAEAMADGDDGYSEYMDDDMMRGRSYARGRDMHTGRYISRRGRRSYEPEPRMSGHSLNDRMVAKLESMMDNTNSDYERQHISEWIDKIRREGTQQ